MKELLLPMFHLQNQDKLLKYDIDNYDVAKVKMKSVSDHQ